MRTIIEWISNSGDLSAEGKGISSWKETFYNLRDLCWERLHPLLEAHQNAHKSPPAGQLAFRRGYFCSGGMIKQERKALLTVQMIRKGRWSNIRDLRCYVATLLLLLCAWTQYLWRGMFGNSAHRGKVHRTFSQIDQNSHYMPLMCKELGIQDY